MPTHDLGDPSTFDHGVAVRATGSGRYAGDIDPRWNIGDAPNGGYLLSIVLSAVAAEVVHPHPLAVSAHFASKPAPGSADLAVDVARNGRTTSTASARLAQDGMVRVVVAATYGDLDAANGPTSIQAERPEFPPPEDCIRAAGANAPPFMQQFDLRLTPETASWAMTKPSGVAEAAGWIRFADGREPDPTCLPLMSDAFPPTVFNVLPSLWVPTIQLTVHVRGRPRPGWLQARFRTRYLIDGHLEEDGEIWDSSGRLVALSRQLARVL